MNQLLDGFKANRKEALEIGDEFFFTGAPCKRGHLAERRVDNYTCMQCMRDRSKTNYRENADEERAKARTRKARRYAENPDPFKDAEKKRRASDPERFKKQAKEYYQKHRQDRISASTAYRKANSDQVKEKMKQKYASLSTMTKIAMSEARRKRWDKNPSLRKKAYERNRKYWQANVEKTRAYAVNRKALIRAAEGKITGEDITFLLNFQKNSCFYCSEALSDYHVDHFIPVSKGGSNLIENIVIACSSCNLRKQARHPLVFIALLVKEGIWRL